MAGKVIVKDLGFEKIKKRIRDMDGWGVTVGVHEDNDRRESSLAFADLYYAVGSAMTNANLYAIHEFGAGRVPERSSLRKSFDKKLEENFKMLARGASLVIAGLASTRSVVALVGEKSTADTVEAIRAGIPPPLAPSTVARKGSSKQLIDTGQLVQAIKPKTGRNLA